MKEFIKVLDGSGKPPRDIQIDYLTHLQTQLGNTRIHALNAPPGVGKSYMARTIQRTFHDCAILSPNNLLVDQYCDTYKELNAIKGKDYYDDIKDYHKARELGESSPNVFNPLSYYYYYLNRPHLSKPNVVVIDEAHKLGEMLLMTIAKSFSVDYYSIPLDLTETEFVEWLNKSVKSLAPFADSVSGKRAKFSSIYSQLKIMQEYLTSNLHKVKIFYEMKDDWRKKNSPKMHLTVQPLTIPFELMDTIFGAHARIILFSGSLTDYHIKELFPQESKVDFVQYEPLAPIENWPIINTPIRKVDRKNPKVIAAKIRQLYLAENKPNTLVHLSYAMAKQVASYLKDLKPITHDKDNKMSQLEVFKKKGGLILASGMAEGVDLPGDLCRLIIIPCLLWPNKGDEAVAKRLALPNGQFWYVLETVMTLVQQVGRGVRGPEDACKTYILDCMLKDTINKKAIKDRLSKKFVRNTQYENV